MDYTIYTDGASKGNPGPSSIGVAIYDHHHELIDKISKNIGHGTSNQAEYEALLHGLKRVKELGGKNISCFSDSQVLTNHVNKIYNVQNPYLMNKMKEIRREIEDFELFNIQHIPRELNKEADYLANLAHQQEKDSQD